MLLMDNIVLEMHSVGNEIRIIHPRTGDKLYVISTDKAGICRESSTSFYRGSHIPPLNLVDPYAVTHGRYTDIVETSRSSWGHERRRQRSRGIFLYKSGPKSIFAS